MITRLWKVVQGLRLNFTNTFLLCQAMAAKIIGFYHINGEIIGVILRFGLCFNPCYVGKVIPYQLVMRMGRAELKHSYQMGCDRISIIIIVTVRSLWNSYRKGVFRKLEHSSDSALK